MYFDVDDTLIYSKDPIFQGTFAALRKWLWYSFIPTHPIRFLDKQFYWDLFGTICDAQKFELIDATIVDTIKKLQQRGVSCIALTAMNIGKQGPISSMEEWRYKDLQRFGFNLSFDEKDPIKKISGSAFTSGSALFYRGILCSSSYSKGLVLKSYLQRLNKKPSKIVFFDDRIKEANSVQRAMDEFSIPCQAFVYRGGYKLHAKSFDFWGMRKRIVHLIEHGEWVAV